MSDSSAVPSALGIESVEWLAEGGESLTVRVTGRWRRRRPPWSGQPMLVIESAGRRHRFPAMPEPPSLTGAGPGMWRMSFTVPAWLASDLGGRTWLQFGAVVVPLPAAVEPPAASTEEDDEREPPPTADPDAEQSRSLAVVRGAELETDRARRRALEAEDAMANLTRRVHELERDLRAARMHSEDLAASLAERELTRRAAEQRAHAEQALRRDLGRRLAASSAEKESARQALGELAAAEERIRGLELELVGLRRRGDEAEQAAAAAAKARERAERRAEQALDELRLEQLLVARRAGTPSRVVSEPQVPALAAADASALENPTPPASSAPGRAPDKAAGPEPLMDALRRELDLRTGAEAALRARLVDTEGRLAARMAIESRTAETLAELRRELDGLRAAFQREREARERAELRAVDLSVDVTGQRERSQHAYAAIDELRGALGALTLGRNNGPDASEATAAAGEANADAGEATADAGERRSEPARPMEPDRFNDARLRLREAIAPADAQPEPGETGPPAQDGPTGAAWLQPIFRTLARDDADAAGRLLLDLLPAQREAYPERVSYDLMLGGRRGCAQITVRDGAPVIRYEDDPRPAEDVDFQVFGPPAAIARLLTAGALRRRLRRGIARVRGKREGLGALRALVRVRLDLRGLYRAGVRLEPRSTLRLVALMIDPAWTARERFNLLYEDDQGESTYLLVRDGRPVRVSGEAPAGRIETRISGPAEALALVLSGERTDRIAVTGEEWPVALLRKWIKRAQSD